MMKYLRSRNAVVAAAGGLLAAFSLSGVAQAVTDTIFKYSTTKTGYYTISAMDMTSDNSAAVFGQSWPDELTGDGYCFNTGVHLPHGATITALSAWSTSTANGNSSFYLYRAKMADGTSNVVGQLHPADDSGTRKQAQVAIVTANLVDNAHYTYGFGLCMVGTGDIFAGARVTYTYTNAGD